MDLRATLRDPTLLRDRALVGAEWIEPRDARTFDVHDAATGGLPDGAHAARRNAKRRSSKKLAAACADTVKRVSLELGGNSPFIVCHDADLELAVASAIFAEFRNAGQACIAPNRFFVHESVLDDFTTRLLAAVDRLKQGDGRARGVDLGPLISEAAVSKVEAHVADALERGAILHAGGDRLQRTGHFFVPTLLTGLKAEMRMFQEETFGPVIGIAGWTQEADLLAEANRTRLGLAGYVFSRDASSIYRITRGLQAGIVGVNTGAIATEVAPFGCYKESGLGREARAKASPSSWKQSSCARHSPEECLIVLLAVLS